MELKNSILLKLVFLVAGVFSLDEASAQMATHVLKAREFHEIYIDGPITATVRQVPDSAGLVLVRSTMAAYDALRKSNVDGNLCMSASPTQGVDFRRELAWIVVYAYPCINTLSVSAGSNIVADSINCPASDLKLIANSRTTLVLSGCSAQSVNVSVNGMGEVTLEGTARCENFNATVVGAGKVVASSLEGTRTVSSTVKGPGSVTIAGEASVSASFVVKGTGEINASALRVPAAKVGIFGDGEINVNRASKITYTGERRNVSSR